VLQILLPLPFVLRLSFSSSSLPLILLTLIIIILLPPVLKNDDLFYFP